MQQAALLVGFAQSFHHFPNSDCAVLFLGLKTGVKSISIEEDSGEGERGNVSYLQEARWWARCVHILQDTALNITSFCFAQ